MSTCCPSRGYCSKCIVVIHRSQGNCALPVGMAWRDGTGTIADLRTVVLKYRPLSGDNQRNQITNYLISYQPFHSQNINSVPLNQSVFSTPTNKTNCCKIKKNIAGCYNVVIRRMLVFHIPTRLEIRSRKVRNIADFLPYFITPICQINSKQISVNIPQVLAFTALSFTLTTIQ